MGKKLTTEIFIERSKVIHGDEYDYSKVKYIGTHSKIKIICKKHGVFEQTPYHHTIRKQSCPKCSKVYVRDNDSFIIKSNEVHNNKYDYSLVEYIKSDIKVKIICPKHGVFEQIPANHIHLKQGCTKCSKNMDTLKEFIKKCNEAHNNKFDYSLVDYKNKKSRIKIICPKHGIFEQFSYAHLDKKQGCPICSESKGERYTSSFLKNLNIKYERQKTFIDCKNIYVIPFDFFLPEYNICIEYDGIQHFKSIEYWGGKESLEKQIIKDEIKTNYCEKNNIKLIRIRYDDDIEERLSEIKKLGK